MVCVFGPESSSGSHRPGGTIAHPHWLRGQPHALVCRLLSGQTRGCVCSRGRHKPTSSIPSQPGFRATPGDFRVSQTRQPRHGGHLHPSAFRDSTLRSFSAGFMITRASQPGSLRSSFFLLRFLFLLARCPIGPGAHPQTRAAGSLQTRCRLACVVQNPGGPEDDRRQID